MRKRQLFYTLRPVFRVLILLHRLIPRPVCRGLMVLSRHVPGLVGVGWRYVLVARLAKSCGDCVAIHQGVYLHHVECMSLGDHISIHPMCYIDGVGGLDVGSDVSIAHATTIMTSEHDFNVAGRLTRDAEMKFAPVRIAENVWIGCGVRILAGVTIEQGAVIGAGAVVTRDVRTNSVAAGVPAREIKQIEKRAA